MSPVRFAKSLVILLLFCVPSWAQTPVVVYENSADFEGVYANYATEYGDEIILAGTARYLTEFDFEYTADYAPTNQVDAVFRLYSNTTVLPGWNPDFKIPTTMLWTSHFDVSPGSHQVKLRMPYIKAQNHLSWTVQFTGVSMTPGDTIGLRFYGLPTVGSGYNGDFWDLLNIGWFPSREPRVSRNNFACKVWAVESMPALSVAAEGPNVRLTWPVGDSSFIVESKSVTTGGIWKAVPVLPTQVGDTFQMVVPAADATQVFRLNTQAQGKLEVSVVGNMLHVRWPAILGGQTLQGRSLSDSQWQTLNAPSRPTGQYYDAAIPIDSDMKFFQLRKIY